MADHDPGGPSRPPPKVKADFAQLLDDAGYQHAPDLTLEAIKRLCAEHGLIPPQPPSEKQLLVEKIARYNEQQDLLGLPRLVYSGRGPPELNSPHVCILVFSNTLRRGQLARTPRAHSLPAQSQFFMYLHTVF